MTMEMEPTLLPSAPAEPAKRLSNRAAKATEHGRESLREAGGKAREAATAASRRLTDSSQTAVAHVRRKPVSSGLLMAVAGAAVLLNPALRRFALAAGPTLWRMVQSRRAPLG